MSHDGHSHGGMNDHGTMATHIHHHTTENPSGQDSHGGHAEASGHVMMFHLNSNLNLLFEPWEISSTKVLVGSCIAILFVSLLYEGLKIFRAKLMHMGNRSAQPTRTNICSFHHWSQTVIHVVQVVVGYLLMLVVMTYQVYLAVAVIIGAGLGYYIFAGLIGETDPSVAPSCPNPTAEIPVLTLHVTHFKDREKNYYDEPKNLDISDLAIENKGFDLKNKYVFE